MTQEMPVRYWKNLPEATLIPGLIRDAVGTHAGHGRQGAPTVPQQRIPAPRLPAARPLPTGSLEQLARAGRATVAPARCGSRPRRPCSAKGRRTRASCVIGEQPGDQEDLAGRPFVGPAGQLFDRALDAAGIDRGALYLTNTVKHFKFEPRGKRRLHARANAHEQAACRHWLDRGAGPHPPAADRLPRRDGGAGHFRHRLSPAGAARALASRWTTARARLPPCIRRICCACRRRSRMRRGPTS